MLLGDEAIKDTEAAYTSLLDALKMQSTGDRELDFSNIAVRLSEQGDSAKDMLEQAELLYFSLRENNLISDWISEFAGNKLDFDHLEHAIVQANDGVVSYEAHHHRKRDGFALTDRRGTRRQVTKQVDYCMICHEREKDSCSKGIHEKMEP